MTIAVVDSGGANIASVLHALGRLGVEPAFPADPAERASRLLDMVSRTALDRWVDLAAHHRDGGRRLAIRANDHRGLRPR